MVGVDDAHEFVVEERPRGDSALGLAGRDHEIGRAGGQCLTGPIADDDEIELDVGMSVTSRLEEGRIPGEVVVRADSDADGRGNTMVLKAQ